MKGQERWQTETAAVSQAPAPTGRAAATATRRLNHRRWSNGIRTHHRAHRGRCAGHHQRGLHAAALPSPHTLMSDLVSPATSGSRLSGGIAPPHRNCMPPEIPPGHRSSNWIAATVSAAWAGGLDRSQNLAVHMESALHLDLHAGWRDCRSPRRRNSNRAGKLQHRPSRRC